MKPRFRLLATIGLFLLLFSLIPVAAVSAQVSYTLTMQVNGGGSTTPAVGAHIYEAGTVVDITAIADPGWIFDSWTGGVLAPWMFSTQVTMTQDKTVTANFVQIPSIITIDVIGSGTTDPPPGDHSYDWGTDVTLTAIPDPGWEFQFWLGDVLYPDLATTTVIADAGQKSVGVVFQPIGGSEEYTLTMQTVGNGSTDPAVGSYPGYPPGAVVTITATPDPSWQFVNWTGDVDDPNANPSTVTMGPDKTAIANFSPIQYTLTMGVTGTGSTDPAVGNHVYDAGTVVTVTATPDPDWQFVNWTGDVADANANPTSVTMDADKTATANFSPIQYTLTMGVSGSGSTAPAVGSYTYNAGTTVNVTALPDPGWKFAGWSGNVADPTAADTAVLMDADKQVTANFMSEQTPEGGVSYWNLDEGSGTVANDSWDGNHGTIVGTAWVAGIVNGALEFDGTTYIDVPNAANLNPAQLTVELWLKPSDTYGNSWYGILSRFPNPTGQGAWEFESQGAPFFLLGGNNVGTYVVAWAATVPEVGKWYQLVGTYDGNEARIYVNGVLEGTALAAGFDPTGPQDLSIGRRTDDANNRFKGVMDEVKVYSRALTDAEILANYQAVAPPAGQYRLDLWANGNGSTSPVLGSHTYDAGTVVAITATPDPDWQFDGWTGDVADANANPTTVTMDADKTVTANFSEIAPLPTQFTLTMAKNGSGTISPAVGSHTYAEGTVVAVTANPAPGWEFAGWSGPVANPSAASTSVTMDADKQVTANFSQITSYTLNTSVNGGGNVSPAAGTHTY
ncbi:MAG: LamG domain-containing protein, partial [Chloroflexi bacterium]|nr:LamG domain-containing protein [Chloroflexota bacterium]